MAAEVQSSVERALSILDSFRVSDPALSLAELARRTGLYKSTILRLAEALQRHGYLERLDGAGYRLGTAAIRLGEVCKRSNRLDEIAMPMLKELAETTGESAALVVRRADTLACLRRVDPPRMVREYIREGDALPLVGAPGRIFRHYERLAERGYRGQELTLSRRTNPSRPLPIVTRGEYEPELATVACPVFGSDAEVLGVIALTGPISRFQPRAARMMGEKLRTACESLTLRSGGSLDLYTPIRPGRSAGPLRVSPIAPHP